MDRSNEYNDLQWAIGLNRCMLKIVGLWPPDSNNIRELLFSKLCRLFNIVILIFVLTIPALMSLIRVWGDMMSIIDNLQYTLPLLITILKVSIMWSKKKVLTSLINMITNDWIKTKVEEERNVMLRYARISRIFATCGGFMILSTLIFGLIFPCFGLTIRSIQIIDNTFHLMLLGLFFLFGILFCLQGFLIINVVHQGSQLSLVQLVSFLAANICVLLHTCLYCTVGELLVTQSERIHRAAYESVWYTIKPQIARNLTLIMLRANKSLRITAGKTFPLTMGTFCHLLKTSAGYISVLLANQD
ncbi:odorant receptor 47a-like isoform X1 [Odontomachus brunneus]|uniref:odorant receptor 47a-like isoform X1 n=1 Tax=Odontomachus brunneus TaxID=486640 RepID=UPI0013F23994|nr:odorant receptor 47a-like isoform X1 [Odontomachus brunneus]